MSALALCRLNRRVYDVSLFLFLYEAPAPTEVSTLSLHDALPISLHCYEPPSKHGSFGFMYGQARSRQSSKFLNRPFQQFARLPRSEEHTSELQSREKIVCRLLLEKKKLQFQRKACCFAHRDTY